MRLSRRIKTTLMYFLIYWGAFMLPLLFIKLLLADEQVIMGGLYATADSPNITIDCTGIGFDFDIHYHPVFGLRYEHNVTKSWGVGAFAMTTGVLGPLVFINTGNLDIGLTPANRFSDNSFIMGGYFSDAIYHNSPITVGAWALSDSSFGVSVGWRY